MKKMNQKKVIDRSARVAGSIGGGIASDFVTSLISDITPDKDIKDPAAKKYTKIIQVGVAAIGVVGSSMITGMKPENQAVKGLLEGMATVQGVKLVRALFAKEVEAATQNSVDPATGETKKVANALRQAFGLGCPCSAQPTQRSFAPSNLGMVSFDALPVTTQEVEPPFEGLSDRSFNSLLG